MMFDWLIPPCLDFVTRQCRELVRTSPMHMVSSMLTMYSILLDELRQVKNIYFKESIKGTSYFLLHFTPNCQFSRTYSRTIIVTDRVDRLKYVQTDAIGKILQLCESFFKILQLFKEQIIQNWQDGTCSEEVWSLLTETFVFDSTFLKRTPRANPCRRSDCTLFTILCKADIFLRSHLVGC